MASKRLAIWRDVLSTPWKWLVAIPFALLGAFAGVRDEFLAPEWRERLKLPQWLPDWRWQTWILIAALILGFAVLEGAYQFVKRRKGLELGIAAVYMMDGPPGTFVLLTIEIKNRGAPSIAEKFNMEAELPTGETLHAVRAVMPPGGFTIPHRGMPKIIQAQDALYLKVHTTPIQTGGREAGYVLFCLEGIGQTRLVAGTRIRVSCTDIDGNIFEVETIWDPRSPKDFDAEWTPGTIL